MRHLVPALVLLAVLAWVAPVDAVVPGENGLIAYSSAQGGGPPAIWTVQSDGSDPRKITSGHHTSVSWSPDGSKIAFTIQDGQNQDIGVSNADGSDVRRLTSDPGFELRPTWSPDGTTIAYERGAQAGESFDYSLWAMNADGSNKRVLVDDRGQQSSPAWSPDGCTIAFAGTGPGYTMDLYGYLVDAHDVRKIGGTQEPDWNSAWSPDSGRLVFQAQNAGGLGGGADEILVVNADGTGLRRLTENGTHDRDPAWSPDGSTIVFTGDRGGDAGHSLVAMPAGGGDERIVVEGGHPASSSWQARNARPNIRCAGTQAGAPTPAPTRAPTARTQRTEAPAATAVVTPTPTVEATPTSAPAPTPRRGDASSFGPPQERSEPSRTGAAAGAVGALAGAVGAAEFWRRRS